MALFQLLRCSVALGGDNDNVVVRGRTNPILFPELMVIQFLHGEDAVTDVHVLGTCEMSQEEALTRLRVIYNAEEVAKVFPGNRPRLPTMDRTIPPCTLPVFKPKPTVPDSPDPILRPLDQYTLADPAAADDGDDMPGFDNPKPYDEDDEDPGVDESLLSPRDDRPRVQDQPQGRTSFKGQGRQARATPSHLPDVAGRQKRKGENEHDRPKG
jgi:hypothetical protein